MAAGFGLGVTLGLSGVGGGVVLTPLLILWLRLPPTTAVADSLAFSLVTKLAGGAQHLRQGTIHRPTVFWLAAGSMPASFLVAWLANGWARRLLSEVVTQRLIVAAVLLAAALLTARLGGLLRPLPWKLSGPALVPAGAALGAVFALTSVGSGSIAVAFLIVATPLEIPSLVGTDIAHAALMASATAPVYLAGARVHADVLLPLLAGSLPGVLVGSRLALVFPQRFVKATVLVAVWVVALRLI